MGGHDWESMSIIIKVIKVIMITPYESNPPPPKLPKPLQLPSTNCKRLGKKRVLPSPIPLKCKKNTTTTTQKRRSHTKDALTHPLRVG